MAVTDADMMPAVTFKHFFLMGKLGSRVLSSSKHNIFHSLLGVHF